MADDPRLDEEAVAVARQEEAWLAAGEECRQAAHAYLARGWSPLVLCPPDHVGMRAEQHKCDSPGKRPVGPWKAYQERRPTAAEVDELFRRVPNGNVGVALGPVSGLVGVDVDGPTGEEELEAMAAGDLPATLEFRTGGGGRRLLYAVAPGLTLRPTHAKGGKGRPLSLLAHGSQTVMPPSRHPSGGRYEWLAGRSPAEVPPAPAPAWLLARLRAEEGPRAAAGAATDGGPILDGCRDGTLTSMAGAMRAHDFGVEAIRAALTIENGRCVPPLADADVDKIARSVGRYKPDPLANVRILLNGRAGHAPGGAAPEAEELPDFGPVVPASELRRVADEAKWLWHGYIARSEITLFSALWKSGKTTLLARLLKALEAPGQFCGLATGAAQVLYVTEEHESLWAERRDLIGIGDHVHFVLRPFRARPNGDQWLAFLDFINRCCAKTRYDLVSFDALSNLWPVKDENDAARVMEAIMPLRGAAGDAALLPVHHMRKGDGQEATASRGSGALTAFVDTILELRRYQPGDRKDRRRVLTGFGRHQETTDELVVELTDDGYVTHGDKADTSFRDILATVEGLLPPSAPGLDYKGVLDAWPRQEGANVPPSARLRGALRDGAANGRWVEEGKGVKGSSFTYWLPVPPPGF